MSNDDTQKGRIADLYHRVASSYGQVEPSIFAYAGQQLVERIGMTQRAQVLDLAAGRGANLFPAAQAIGSNGQVTGIDLAPGMVQETAAEIKRQHLSHATMIQMDAEHLTFPDISFDYVLCSFAIFLFPHLEQALTDTNDKDQADQNYYKPDEPTQAQRFTEKEHSQQEAKHWN